MTDRISRGMADRISSGMAAAICGLSPKTVRKHAAQGIIPGAALLGSHWRFDERRLRDWIRQREAEVCRGKTSSNAAASTTSEFMLVVSSAASAYERLLCGKRKSGAVTP